jgi:hypothetical protein
VGGAGAARADVDGKVVMEYDSGAPRAGHGHGAFFGELALVKTPLPSGSILPLIAGGGLMVE